MAHRAIVDGTEMISVEWHKAQVNEAVMNVTTMMTHERGFRSDTWSDLEGTRTTTNADLVRWLLEPIPPALVLAKIAEEVECTLPFVNQLAMQALAHAEPERLKWLRKGEGLAAD